MIKAYLQNKKAQYYYLMDDGSISLTENRKELQTIPEAMESVQELVSGSHQHNTFTQTGFIFRNDGCRIVSHLFFTKGRQADCVLTLEPDNTVCGDLDFSTARVYGNKEIRISCMHF